MGSVASATVTAFIDRRYSNGSVVTGDRYVLLSGNECGVLAPTVCKALISSGMENPDPSVITVPISV